MSLLSKEAASSWWENVDPRFRKNVHTGIAGIISGGFAALLTCPLDVIKTRLQVQKFSTTPTFSSSRHPLFGLTLSIWEKEGFRGYYRGLGTILFALMPNWACFFTAYNEFKFLGESFFDPSSSTLHAVSALGAATITNVVTQPIWTIKTRLQTQTLRSTEIQYRGTFHAFATIIRTEGVRALYSGFLAQSVGGVHVIIQFPAYEKLKVWLKERKQMQIDDPEGGDNLSPLQIIFASSVSKLLGSTLAYPTEVVRSRMQFQRSGDLNRYSGFTNAIVRIWSEEGIRGFYSGLLANMCRVIPACAITFLAYEIVLEQLERGTT